MTGQGQVEFLKEVRKNDEIVRFFNIPSYVGKSLESYRKNSLHIYTNIYACVYIYIHTYTHTIFSIP